MEQTQPQEISWNVSFKNLPVTSHDRRITWKLFLIFLIVIFGVAVIGNIIYGSPTDSFENKLTFLLPIILVTAALQFVLFLIYSTFIWPKGKTKSIDFSYTLSEHGIITIQKSLNRTLTSRLSWKSITKYECPITEKSLSYQLQLGPSIGLWQSEAEKNDVKPFVVWSYMIPIGAKSYPHLLYTPESLNNSVKTYIEQHAGNTVKRVTRWFSRLLLFFLVVIFIMTIQYFTQR